MLQEALQLLTTSLLCVTSGESRAAEVEARSEGTSDRRGVERDGVH